MLLMLFSPASSQLDCQIILGSSLQYSLPQFCLYDLSHSPWEESSRRKHLHQLFWSESKTTPRKGNLASVMWENDGRVVTLGLTISRHCVDASLALSIVPAILQAQDNYHYTATKLICFSIHLNEKTFPESTFLFQWHPHCSKCIDISSGISFTAAEYSSGSFSRVATFQPWGWVWPWLFGQMIITM